MSTITLYRSIACAALPDWVHVSTVPFNDNDLRRGEILIDEIAVELPEMTKEQIDAAIKRAKAQLASSAVKQIDEQDRENAA
ncbi:hypothetical protein [Marinobacterium sp. MBR-109]|jgi:hypothetical protein|uniref:hypothetical protein n=1 Tax=Marinobacterium sp. MBR-109 TaxID=3156462 RepID=UPI003395F48E